VFAGHLTLRSPALIVPSRSARRALRTFPSFDSLIVDPARVFRFSFLPEMLRFSIWDPSIRSAA
jgi:hypothetical protein